MSEHRNDPTDAAIDRVARQLVEHDPSQAMHAAVMSRVRERQRHAPWSWWSLALPAAAMLVVAVVFWSGPRRPVDETARAPHEPVIAEPPPPFVSAEKPAAAASGKLPRRQARVTPVAEAPPVWPGDPPPPIEVRAIGVDSVRVRTIEPDSLVVPAIRISEIDIEAR